MLFVKQDIKPIIIIHSYCCSYSQKLFLPIIIALPCIIIFYIYTYIFFFSYSHIYIINMYCMLFTSNITFIYHIYIKEVIVERSSGGHSHCINIVCAAGNTILKLKSILGSIPLSSWRIEVVYFRSKFKP